MATVQVIGTGFASDQVTIHVSAGPPQTVRVLHSGRALTQPFTIVFFASAAILDPNGTVRADPILQNRAGFQDVVAFALNDLFTMREALLREDDIDRKMRIVVIFDAAQTVGNTTALVEEVIPDLVAPRQEQIAALISISRYGEQPDIVFAVTGSSVPFTRGTAWWTIDEHIGDATPFTYDGFNLEHPHQTALPGCIALLESTDQTGMTPLHEFGHAVSNELNGQAVDLYVEIHAGTGIAINKKYRTNSSDPIPSEFAVLDGVTYMSDQQRGEIGYPRRWNSYHPRRPGPQVNPNVMDDFWQAPDPQQCVFDSITAAWLRGRLTAKVER